MIELKPGDYVSTEGMTDEQHKAVAEAFMAAGADSGEYGDMSYCVWRYVGWHDDRIRYWDGTTFGPSTRLLTVDEVLGAATAQQPEHKPGDLFEVLDNTGPVHHGFKVGATVRLEDVNAAGHGYFACDGYNYRQYINFSQLRKLPAQQATWQGLQDWLPPVGSTVLAVDKSGTEYQVEVAAHHGGKAIFFIDDFNWDEGERTGKGVHYFTEEMTQGIRPIRTKKQQQIEALQKDLDVSYEIAERMVDKGCAKPA